MSIFIVTGKLGGGKTLAAVSKINDALGEGRRVATNLDLTLSQFPSCNHKTKSARVIRVPDRPSVADIQSIGFGMEGVRNLADARRLYDEKRFGILVLDECGTWLNSRDWQADGRRELINFLLHIRKHLWDVYLIIQDISMLDKQARKALAEHCVYCRRMDRMNIPLMGTLSKMLLGKSLKFPKWHVGHVKYGDQPQSLTVDKWWYKGRELYTAYDTTQVFADDYPHGCYSMLPPWYWYQSGFVAWNWRKIMQLTKIYLRQYSRTILLAAGVFAGASVAHAFAPEKQSATPTPVAVEIDQASGSLPGSVANGQGATPALPLVYRLRITSFASDNFGTRVRFSDGFTEYSPDALQAIGISAARTGRCRYRLDYGMYTALLDCVD